ncbi:ArsR family transcriptional regulator [Methanolobus sp. ZRKC3]|uniref:ArsR family transcriptional regulator n=1 Tax=Methanolobus sp. ZRKC3 TaxID=3125786 RepID=UPI003247AA43
MNNGDSTAIFSTDEGFIALNGPVKVKILEFLKPGPRSFDEIVKHTEKAKATISVHLKDLKSSNLLEERVDSNDKRKKIYSLTCQYVACSQEPGVRNYLEMLDVMSSGEMGKYGCIKCVFHAVQYGFRANGINCDPIMRNIGRDVGKSLSKNLVSTEQNALFEEMMKFWEDNEIGRFTVIGTDPLTIAVHNFFDCRSIPVDSKSLCSFAQGVFEGVFRDKFGDERNMQIVETCGNDCDSCIFIMK